MKFANLPVDALDQMLVTSTDNWAQCRWRGHVLWQNLLDLNVLSEYVIERCPEVIVETGTWEGGSAIFFADMMLLSGREPDVLSIDIQPRATPAYRGIRYLSTRSSTDPAVVEEVVNHTAGRRVFVVLDSDHSGAHVLAELQAYAPLISFGDHILVQDGNLRRTFGWAYADTPLWGIERFLATNDSFEIDESHSPFASTAHPYGWLRRLG